MICSHTGWQQVQSERTCEAYGEPGQHLDDTEPNGFVKKITRAFMVLISNPVFILISIAGASESKMSLSKKMSTTKYRCRQKNT